MVPDLPYNKNSLRFSMQVSKIEPYHQPNIVFIPIQSYLSGFRHGSLLIPHEACLFHRIYVDFFAQYHGFPDERAPISQRNVLESFLDYKR